MEVVVIAGLVGIASYLYLREKRNNNFRPRPDRKEHLPEEMSHSDYIEKVMAEANEKERVTKLQAENRERIKKDFL